jgi:hypothetical protein
MDIKIPENLNADLVMRRSSYGFLRDRQHGTESYVRRLGGGFYPRFHVYIKNGIISLHLDQKQASYKGSHAHSGEYDGETVQREIMRIQEVMVGLQSQPVEPKKEEKTGFFGGLFGK